MDGRIESCESKTLAGVSFYGDPFTESAGWTEENEIGRLWNRFTKLYQSQHDRMPPMTEANCMYELHIWDELTAETGNYEVFIGYVVSDVPYMPVNMLVKAIPASNFAVFTLKGEAIRDTDTYPQMDTWIEENGYKRGASWMYNLYDHRYKGVDNIEDSIIDVFLPIAT